MRTLRRLALILLASSAACSRGPSRADALAAIRRAHPELDSATVTGRVWQDGPPWFSCAEVLAKASSRTDSAAVRDQVGNWKPLVLKGWIVLRDTAKGPVADPGWCSLKLTDAGQARASSWTVSPGDAQPMGMPRRGWVMPLGHHRISVVAAPKLTASDAATAEYIVTVATNEDGAALGANRDTLHFVAELASDHGGWTMRATRPAVPVSAGSH